MSELAEGMKGDRTLRLLLGLHHPRVVDELRLHGFTSGDRDRGWAELKAFTARLVAPGEVELTALKDWAEQWISLADHALRPGHRRAREWLFVDLPREGAEEAVLAVAAFVQRVKSLPRALDLREEGRAARALLERLGLDGEVVGQAEQLLRSLGGTEAFPADAAALASLEHQMWNWYTQWSQVTRAAMEQRRMRLRLGHRDAATEIRVDNDVRPQGVPVPVSGRDTR